MHIQKLHFSLHIYNKFIFNFNAGLTCGKDNCPSSLGWPNWVDCCINATATPAPPTTTPLPGPKPGDHNYCSTQNKCAENEGDCDNDSHCNSGLKCGKDNCPARYGYNHSCKQYRFGAMTGTLFLGSVWI